MRRALVALATALLVITAGCAGTMGTATPAADGTSGDDAASADGSTTSDSTAGDSGTVNVYVSDEPNDMDDFEHLNVTVTTVTFHLVDAADDESADETDASTATPVNETDEDETPTAVETDANETEADDEARDEREDEAENDEDDEVEADDEESEDGRWVTREVNASEVDLSELRGANATLLEQFDLPAGEYNKVHMEVGEIDATLKNGDSQRVKLPSNKLQLNSEFTVENGSEVDFVYDVTVHKAGNSGKYILKPVVSESGTAVPIERVDGDREDDERADEGENEDRDDEGTERSIDASVLGNVTAGESVTVQVTENGTAVENATVFVDDERVGTTDATGEYVVNVPSNAEELDITVEAGDAEAELEHEFEAAEGAAADDDAGSQSDDR